MKSAKSALGTCWIACVLAFAAGCSSADDGAAANPGEPSAGEVANAEGSDSASLLSRELAAPGGVPTNPCAAVLCAAPSTCEVVNGEAVCVDAEPDACAGVRCREGRHCEVIDDRPRCVRDEAPNPCAAVTCLAPSTCEVIDGQGVCVSLDSCASVRCPGGTTCQVVDGSAECLPDPDPNPCAAVLCPAPSTCELIRGEAVCVPVEEPNPCAAVTCLAPSTCEVIDGQGVCVGLDEPNPCAAVLCPAPSTCEVIDGEAACVPVGPFCGGIAGFACPGAGVCVDVPGDGCDPERGGADCGGVCTCPVLALCVEGQVFDDSPEVCACVPAGEGGECRE